MLYKAYVELDALLDTRISTVARLNPQAAMDLLGDHYRKRKSDELWLLHDGFSKEDYLDGYKKRDKETLAVSRITPLIYVVGSTMREKLHEVASSPTLQVAQLDVNIYPYELTDVEKKDFVDCIMAYSDVEVKVNLISISPIELTFIHIRNEGYKGLFVYNFSEWAEIHIPKIEAGQQYCPAVTMVVPELLQSIENFPSDEELTMANGRKTTPFEALQIALAPFIRMQYVSVDLVSILEFPQDLNPKGKPA